MSKRKKRQRMPRWIWQLKRHVMNTELKRFLSYIWWSGDRGCRDWNYQLAQRFDVSKRTIRRWLHRLQNGHLITINFPHGKLRTVYRLPYFKQSVWNQQRRKKRAVDEYARSHPVRAIPPANPDADVHH